MYKEYSYSPITKSSVKILVPWISNRQSKLYSTYKTLHTGLDIQTHDVYGFQSGVVTQIGKDEDGHSVVTVQYSGHVSLRYGHLMGVYVKSGETLFVGSFIGVAYKYVHFEYVTTESSIWPVHIGTITYYKQLKKNWKVSIAAMIRRSEKLGIITTDDYQNLIRIMQRRGLRKEEPLDDTLITASPALLKTSVIMLLQENVFTPAEFMEELSDSYGLSINATEVERLLDLPAGTLAAHKIIKLPKFTIKEKCHLKALHRKILNPSCQCGDF